MSQSTIKRIERLSLILAGAATLLSLFSGDLSVVIGVALGGFLAVANFYALRRMMQGLLEGRSQRKRVAAGIMLTLKFGILAALIFLIIRLIPVNPIALLVGITTVVLAIFIEGFRAVLCGATASPE